MPRPTRTRAAAASAPAKKVAEPSRSNEASDNIYGVSDREIEHQEKTIEPASARAAPSDRSNTTMTRRSTRNRRSSVVANSSDLKALQDSKKQRDVAMSMLDNLTSTADDTPNASDMIASPVVEAGRNTQMDASSLLGGPRPLAGGGNLSGLEINDSEIFGNLDSSFDDSRAGGKDVGNNSSSVGGGTRSADTSAFNVSVFKRQPRRRRQSSIVSRDDAPIRPSSRGPTTPGLSSNFSLGNFKRRQRQPSILLSSAQKATLSVQRSRAASAASENAVGSGDEEESFLPEAEGTPVRPSKGRRSSARGAAVEEGEDATEARPRKRKSAESHHEVEAAKRRAVESEEVIHQSIEMDDASSPPSVLSRTPELDDSVLAPPASGSESEGSPTMWPSLKNLGRKQYVPAASRSRKTPVLDDDESDLSEPPSLTHSPNLKATGAKNKGKAAQRKESPKLTTADLEALLPRRRRKVRRSDEGEDGDEAVSDLDAYDVSSQPRNTRKKTGRPLAGSSKTNGTVAAKQTAAPTRKTRHTYGSRVFDKENTVEGDSIQVSGDAASPVDDSVFEADADATTTSLDLGAELKAASRKFKEVDKWELDFEEVVESSSPLPEGR